jgi:hypothetical protein
MPAAQQQQIGDSKSMLEMLTLDQGVFCAIPAVRQISAGSRNHLQLELRIS